MVKAPAAGKKAAEARGPARKELQQNRWQIENWVACEGVELQEDEVQRSHAVYVSRCSECVIQVRPLPARPQRLRRAAVATQDHRLRRADAMSLSEPLSAATGRGGRCRLQLGCTARKPLKSATANVPRASLQVILGPPEAEWRI